jgi:hypothetical protein
MWRYPLRVWILNLCIVYLRLTIMYKKHLFVWCLYLVSDIFYNTFYNFLASRNQTVQNFRLYVDLLMIISIFQGILCKF